MRGFIPHDGAIRMWRMQRCMYDRAKNMQCIQRCVYD